MDLGVDGQGFNGYRGAWGLGETESSFFLIGIVQGGRDGEGSPSSETIAGRKGEGSSAVCAIGLVVVFV